ncbi:GAF domain-containing protein [Desulfobulbus alkaliphilus]|uniref:GAF domain-containing protein n=1 Tax=Desulfobulbus alkaliphilus TaxID=869814 RepID=UPI001963F217|nr:GAF domain-containing protein [Desulfobulbus alkaliphilus]MBM9537283.1 GAF domain-containing protein [Desulfobulbus alkaliphilus]
MTLDAKSTAAAKLDAVVSGARAILGQQNFTDAARAIFDHCREITGAVSGYVALLSEDGQENEVLFLEAGGVPCSVAPELPMPIRGLRSIAYETHRATYDNDFMKSEWVKYMPDGHAALKNVMFAPLNIDGKTVGLMGLANKPADFTDEDAEIAMVFGDLAAIALANSRQMDLLREKNHQLQCALSEIKTLRSILPMCCHCRNVRDDKGVWSRLEAYLSAHTDTSFSHGLCPDCLRELYPENADAVIERMNARAKG